MSFILDALKKSENDRQRQSAPALFEVKVAPPRRRLPLWAAGLAVLFVLNVGALAWLLLRAPAAPATAANPAPADASAPAPAVAAPAAPPGMVTVPATVTIPTTVNIPASSAPAITIGAQGAQEPQAGAIAPSMTPPLAEEPMLSGQEPTVTPEYDASDYAEAVSASQARAAQAARNFGGLPSRDEVLARGTPLPELRLDMHVYAANPADRFVFINMRKLREGESLPDGTRVDAITQNGVQLWYRGTRFTIDGH